MVASIVRAPGSSASRWFFCIALVVLSAARAERAYVYDGYTAPSSVHVIDTATCQEIRAVSFPDAPNGVAAGTKRVYVSLPFRGEIRTIDDSSGLEAAAPLAVGWAQGLALLPDESLLYVAVDCASGSSNCGSVKAVDTATMTVKATIAGLNGPRAISSLRDGSRIYVTTAANTVVGIDTTTNIVVQTIPVGHRPAGVAVDVAGRLVVANMADNTVSVIDSVTGQVLGAPIAVGDGPIAVATHPTAERAFVTNWYSGTVSVIDTATRARIATLPTTGAYASGIAISRRAGSGGTVAAYVVNSCSAKSGACNQGSMDQLDTGANTLRTCAANAGMLLEAFGEFLTREQTAKVVRNPCERQVCTRVPVRDYVLPCLVDPYRCVPPGCCGSISPDHFDPAQPGVFIAKVDGGRVEAASGVEVRQTRIGEFRRLEPGTILHRWDILRLHAGSQLRVASAGGAIRTAEEGLPRWIEEDQPVYMLIASPQRHAEAAQ